MNVLLVEPKFPIPTKSKNHRDFLPIGLLKLASYHRKKGDRVKLVRGNEYFPYFKPHQIKITSLFTYWSKYVWDTVYFYKERYPKAKVSVGGIYASLMPDHCKGSGCDEVFVGVHKDAENCKPAYDLVDVDYQIVHSTRGCIRRCKFCGTWKIEPKFIYKKSIKDEICSNRIIFYDNNVLANPYIGSILSELSQATYRGRAVYSESQCGIDGRLLTKKLAKLLKRARFLNPRIAWDHKFEQHNIIKNQLDKLVKAGYRKKDIYIFMVYNWEIPFKEMEKKRLKCWEWGVQIADCRFRPLNQTFDHYDGKKKQTEKDYYIHPKWTDEEIKQFRRNVRGHNICVRQKLEFYSRALENKRISKKEYKNIIKLSKGGIKKRLPDAWFPDEISFSEINRNLLMPAYNTLAPRPSPLNTSPGVSS